MRSRNYGILKLWDAEIDAETMGCRNEFGMTEIKDFGQFRATPTKPVSVQDDKSGAFVS